MSMRVYGRVNMTGEGATIRLEALASAMVTVHAQLGLPTGVDRGCHGGLEEENAQLRRAIAEDDCKPCSRAVKSITLLFDIHLGIENCGEPAAIGERVSIADLKRILTADEDGTVESRHTSIFIFTASALYLRLPTENKEAAERVPSAARPSQELAQSDANGMATLEALVKDSEEALMEVEECNDGPDVFEDTVADEEDMAKRLRDLRKSWVEERDTKIVFGTGTVWKDVEADEATFDKKDLGRDANPVEWEALASPQAQVGTATLRAKVRSAQYEYWQMGKDLWAHTVGFQTSQALALHL
ncbi:Putative membrane protein C24H6.13 [Durusdinium trenchii]|uniref:Membrane protein C24H6.13 n=1 Tax=Durusdinium trenchii TaxID=1381693 RepID=A0ABP0LKX9_9DINO